MKEDQAHSCTLEMPTLPVSMPPEQLLQVAGTIVPATDGSSKRISSRPSSEKDKQNDAPNQHLADIAVQVCLCRNCSSPNSTLHPLCVPAGAHGGTCVECLRAQVSNLHWHCLGVRTVSPPEILATFPNDRKQSPQHTSIIPPIASPIPNGTDTGGCGTCKNRLGSQPKSFHPTSKEYFPAKLLYTRTSRE